MQLRCGNDSHIGEMSAAQADLPLAQTYGSTVAADMCMVLLWTVLMAHAAEMKNAMPLMLLTYA